MIKFLLLLVSTSEGYYGYGGKSDSRMPEVLYQLLVPGNVFLGSSVSGSLVSNQWINGTDERCKPAEDGAKIISTLDEVLNCTLLPADFTYDTKLSLVWSQYPDDVVISEVTLTISPNSNEPTSNFEFAVPINIESSRPTDYASLQLKAKTFWSNGTEMSGISDSAYLTLKKTDQILIQSDKAKYKPGNLVQFRIITLNQDLAGLASNVDYEIKSPSNNMMSQGTKVTTNGVVEGKFQLDAFAEQGEWEIKVKSDTDTDLVEESYKFDVEEYVLPKFEVKIAGANFLVEKEEMDFAFNIEAKYTFGKSVPGRLEVTLKKLPCEIPYWAQGNLQVACLPDSFTECPEYDDNGCPASPAVTQTFNEFNGGEANTIPAKHLNSIFSYEADNYYCNCGKTLLMEASVTDKYSGEVQTAQKMITVEQSRYKLKWLYEPPQPRPDVGMKYIAQATLIDGSSLDTSGDLMLKVWSGYEYDGCKTCHYEEDIQNIKLDAAATDGIFTVSIPEQFFNMSSFSVSASFTSKVDGFDASVTSYYSSYGEKTDQELRLTANAEGKLVPGTTTTFTIGSNYAGKPTFYAIARGRIIMTKILDVAADSTTTIDIDIDSLMIPEARFLVTENLGTGWVADSVSYFVEEMLDNQVTITASATQVQVGDMVNIDVTAAENSPVYFLGVDQSVLLLKSGNDIDEKKVLQVLQDTQEKSWRPWPIWGGCGIWFPWSYGNQATDKINDAGLQIISVRSFQEPIFMYDAMEMEMPPEAVLASTGGGSSSPMEIKTRKKFPETWIWDTVTTDSNGVAQLSNLTVPDTITSWVVTAFSMSAEKGLGLDPTAEKIIAFQNFFIKLYLPYSVKQNEDFLIRAVIYNYLSSDVTVEATLYENDMFEPLLGAGHNVKSVSIPKDQAVQVAWPVRAVRIGAMPIKVRAVAGGNMAGDELQRVLIVKPEGVAKTKVFNGLLQDTSGGDEVKIEFPANVVLGSQRLEVRVFGNIMANTLSNIDKLLKMPYGCGEQNMVNFAPAVFIYRYLSETNKLTDAIEAKAKKIIQTGYQRQLGYRHNEGGFSAWGESEWNKDGPSTLLSSFVLKCFRAANDLMNQTVIDDEIIAKEMTFLAGTFKKGNFVENGKVFSSYLMGALNKNGAVAGTAYALIPFIESPPVAEYSSMVAEAMTTLAQSIDRVDDVHTLAMITYCLTLGEHPDAKLALEKLLGLGRHGPGVTDWLVDGRWSGESVSVEVASYVLLSYAHNLPETLDDALPVFRGITQQLSESGGFKSTQDTVIGIQAMAKFAAFLSDEDMNVEIRLELDDQAMFVSEPITNDNSNLVIINHVNLTETFSSGTAKLSSSGQGSVFTQLVQHYNVRDASQEPFDLEFQFVSVVKRDTESAISNRICVRINTKATDNEEFRVPNGMSLLMVEHPSGFEYSSHTVEDASETPQKVEHDGEKTTFYYNDMEEEKVLTICMVKTEDVANPRPIYITVQDYYNPDAASNAEVELVSQQDSDLCALCGQYCEELCPSSTSVDTTTSSTPGTGNAEGTNWAVAKPTKWLAPKAVLDFQREHNLNMERFKAYVNRRVRDMRNRGRPQKLIELLSAPEGSPFEMFSQDTYRKEISLFVPYGFDMEELTTDLLAHLTMQLKILKQIMSN